MGKKFVVAIPTYNRYKILKDNTLKLLKQYNFNTKELVYIFVANEDEATRYKEILDENDYNRTYRWRNRNAKYKEFYL
jgi:hypothetical protein